MRTSTPPRTPGTQSTRELERSLESMIQSADQNLRQLRSNHASPASTRKSAMKSRSASAPRTVQISSSSSGPPADADTNRKIDFLLKKTKKLEDAFRSLNSQYTLCHEENKELKATIRGYAETLRNNERTSAQLREQLLNIKTRLDLSLHKESIRDTGSRVPNCPHDVGALSEQVFQRVYREFKSVIDEVTRQLHHQAQKPSFPLDYPPRTSTADIDQLRTSICQLKRSQDTLDQAHKEHASQTQLAISHCTAQVHDELSTSSLAMRSTLEHLSRQINESLSQNITNLREEIFTKYDTSLSQLSASDKLHSKRLVDLESILDQHKHVSEQITSDITQLRHYLTSQRQHKEEDVTAKLNYLHDKHTQLTSQLTTASSSIRQLHGSLATTSESIDAMQEQLSEHITDTTTHIARLTEAGRNTSHRLKDLAASYRAISPEEIDKIQETLRNILTRRQIDDRIHDICESTVKHSVTPLSTQLTSLAEVVERLKPPQRHRLSSDDVALSDMHEIVHSSDEETSFSSRKRPSLTLVFPDAKEATPLVRKPSLTTLVYPDSNPDSTQDPPAMEQREAEQSAKKAKANLQSRSSSSEAYPIEPLDSSIDCSVTQTADRLGVSDNMSVGTEVSRTFDIATVLALYEKKRRHRRKFQAKLK